MPAWEFWAQQWEEATQTAEADRQRRCPIKGDISRSGERIYHMPWQSTYAHVTINEGAGGALVLRRGQGGTGGVDKGEK